MQLVYFSIFSLLLVGSYIILECKKKNSKHKLSKHVLHRHTKFQDFKQLCTLVYYNHRWPAKIELKKKKNKNTCLHAKCLSKTQKLD